jgi:uncharacterized membrane protein SpoIIM required for sporulation
MDYARFIGARRAVWDDFEDGLRRLDAKPPALSHAELEAVALGYRKVLHDHSVAAARFPGTAASRRLRHLAFDGTRALYRDAAPEGGVVAFVTRTFPRAFRAHLPFLAVTVALFAVALVLGVTLSVVEPGVGIVFLGPGAVAGLREGRLWTEALVSTVPPSVSSSGIATNNIAVALTGWAGGALAGIGALYVVLMNGFLLGAIVGTTAHYGLEGRLLEFISAHGPLEITLILVTASGGLSLGHALVAADDRPRHVAIGDAARRAVALLLGCLPWFAVLGLVEAVISPAPGLPPSLKVALGIALEAVFLVMAVNPFLTE